MKITLLTNPIIADLDLLVNSFFECQENSKPVCSKFTGNEFEEIILKTLKEEEKWSMI